MVNRGRQMSYYEVIDTGNKSLLGSKRFKCTGQGFTGYGFDEKDAILEWKEAKYIGEFDE
ncbi:hypothetical protein SADIYA_67 [Escherichia phage vB_EcoD_Sadiya]|uniref:Uncharacterized protein n=1 Tax=Escherichia phage vB_EcoD_Sadiya TaxID=2902684 RepID=A0AC61TRK3_9CAUD|nr:hypothetical protein PHLEASOLO_68 [Escherichia phage vB_ EcoD_Phleasolo]UGV22756.1 hypothetical protein SADIYA_67 [Escherichia phage vB_EcoD_Sadiya]